MKKNKFKFFKKIGFIFSCMVINCGSIFAVPKTSDLETALEKQQWNEAAEMAHEMLLKEPHSATIKLKGAYALFQRGFTHAALQMLKKIQTTDWRALPQGKDRLVEIVMLFRKKVPYAALPGNLDQVNINDVSVYLQDEVRFAKGRDAFERQNFSESKKLLSVIPAASRFYTHARYLLGTIAVKEQSYKTAADEFSKIFAPAVFEQSTEFWRDISTQMTSHWGVNLKVKLDAELLNETTKVGELALLGMARLAYATQSYEAALMHYSKISPTSVLSPHARLEKIWTLLALNRHDEAQQAASQLSVDEFSFESIEARVVRALILADAGRTQEAREEIKNFINVYEIARKALEDFAQSQLTITLPSFLKNELKQDHRLETLEKYQEELKQEILVLQQEDSRLFPIYSSLATDIQLSLQQSKTFKTQWVMEHINRCRRELERLYQQSKLIVAETYLEDRESLRTEFKNLVSVSGGKISEAKQREHDERLIQLLEKAVAEVDDVLKKYSLKIANLEFRQGELLWELASARAMLSLTTHSQEDQNKAEALKKKSLALAEDIVKSHPSFDKHSQALFFLGFAHLEVGRTQEGMRLLELYIKQYPQHSHIPDAYRILADAKFDMNKFSEAEQLYSKILSFQDSPIIGYAFYKIGWCAYNTHDFARALLGLEKAFSWTLSSKSERQVLSLKREAQHDLIALFAEVGDHRKAFDYFSQISQANINEWVPALAQELDRIGQYEKAIDLYKSIIVHNPNSDQNILFQSAVINDAYHLRRWPQVMDATKELLQKYQTQIAIPQAEDSPLGEVEKTVRNAVLTQQLELKKVASDENFDRVLELDDLYLKGFGQWPSSQDPLYRHAHFLLEKKKISEASEAYRKHWVQFKNILKEPVREEALRNLIHSTEQVEAEVKNPTALSPSAQNLLMYSNEYIISYPSTKYTRSIQFLSAALQFKYKQNEAAIIASQKLFDTDPSDEIAKKSFKNLRVIYYDLKDWNRIYKWATDMSARKQPAMSAYKQDLKAIREEALFLMAENTQEPGQSAALYQQIAQEPDMIRLRDKSLYNAFIKLEKSGKKLDAVKIAEQLEKSSPQFEGLNQLTAMRAALYQEAGDYVRAQPLLEKFLKQPPKDVAANILNQAHLNAALIAEAMGNLDGALGHYRKCDLQNEEVKRGLKRLDLRSKKSEIPQFNKWSTLQKMRVDFERQAIPLDSDLATRIKKGAENLELLTKAFSDVAADNQTPTFYAFESFCTLPFLYEAYAQGVRKISLPKGLSSQEEQELRGELEKIAAPIDLKIKEIAEQCITKSADAEHEGANLKKVLEKWKSEGSISQEKLQALQKNLEQGAPWMDFVATTGTEESLVTNHYQGIGTDDSWYALGKIRFDQKKLGLARLTFVDALSKNPRTTGRLINAITVIDHNFMPHQPGFSALYEQAVQTGSQAAYLNLALYHLKGLRSAKALAVLKRAQDSGALDAYNQLKILIKDVLPQ